jgi:hypothetical protein
MQSDNLCASVFDKDLPASFFINVNRYLFKKYEKDLIESNDKKTLIRSLWKSELDLDLCIDSFKEYSYIRFNNTKDKTLFFMRWS